IETDGALRLESRNATSLGSGCARRQAKPDFMNARCSSDFLIPMVKRGPASPAKPDVGHSPTYKNRFILKSKASEIINTGSIAQLQKAQARDRRGCPSLAPITLSRSKAASRVARAILPWSRAS